MLLLLRTYAVLSIAVLHARGQTSSSSSRASTRVAFIGNSYTFFNDLPSILASYAASGAGITVAHTSVTPGGSSIFQHANMSLKMGQQTKDMLADPAGWNYTILQDQSETPGGGRDTDDALAVGVGRNLSIHALTTFFRPSIAAAGAVPVLYSTWGRHDGDPPNAECCGYGDFRSMTARTTHGYQMYAGALGNGGARTVSASSHRGPTETLRSPLIAPCGMAFELVYNSTTDPMSIHSTFSCLYNHIIQPNASAGVKNCTLSGAGHGGHPSLLGSYLIAAVFYGTIFNRTPMNVSWAPVGISDSDRTFVQQIAHTAVFGSA